MKLKLIILLLIILQSGSCTQRYVFLKKVRVSNKSATTQSVIEKKTPNMVEIPSLETASANTTINLVPTQPFFISRKTVVQEQHIDSIPIIKDQHITQKKAVPGQKSYTEPEEPKHNKYARTAFILSLLAIASVVLFWTLPFVSVLAIFIFGAMAQDYGGKAYKQLKTSQEKGKWMALVGVILGSLIISAAIAFILAFSLNFSSSASDALFYKEIVIIALGMFALLMRARFHVPKPKRPKQLKPTAPKIAPGPDSWNGLAIATLIVSAIALISVGIIALTSSTLFALILFFSLLAALFFGIFSLVQIKSTHQKGKRFALMGILLLPTILVLITPPLAILALLIGITWWLIQRHNRKKANKVSLS